MRRAGGRVLTEHGVVEGTVLLDDDGRITRLEEGPCEGKVDLPGVVAACPTNAHTHLADRLARERIDAEGLSVEEAVAPPDGLKHRILRSTSTKRLVDSIRQALREAHEAGARRVIDFREGGPQGARALREAARGLPVHVTVLGRPSRAERWSDEADLLVDLVDGIGISGLEDQPLSLSEEQAAWATEHGKRLALHLSEARREDVEAALSLEPDLLVHGTRCTDEDIQAIADAGVPLAACPRANALFGNRPPLETFLEAGVHVGLGTDNAMFHDPDPLAEAAHVARDRPSIPAETILAMACSFRLRGEPETGLGEGQRIVVVDDGDGLREGLEHGRIQTPGRIER